MKSYDGLMFRDSYGTHTVRVHLQNEKYKGWFQYKIDGDCKGLDILEFDFDSFEPDEENIETDNLQIKLDNDMEYFVLTFDDSDDVYELEPEEIAGMVVCIEIVDFEEKSEADND